MIEAAALIGLAAWRLTALLSYERGPWDIFLRVRERMGFQHDETGQPVVWPDRNLPRLVACPWCLGVWVTPTVGLLWLLWPPVVVLIAASAVLIAVERWNNH